MNKLLLLTFCFVSNAYASTALLRTLEYGRLLFPNDATINAGLQAARQQYEQQQQAAQLQARQAEILRLNNEIARLDRIITAQRPLNTPIDFLIAFNLQQEFAEQRTIAFNEMRRLEAMR